MMVGPMEGVVTPALAMASNELQLIPTWVTPFLRVSMQLYPDKFVSNFIKPFISPHAKVIMQLMGNEPKLLSATVQQIKKLNLVDGFNLNFGCPSRKVMSGNCGGGALKNPQLMQEIIQTIRRDNPEVNLSAKIRLGYYDINEMETIIPLLSSNEDLDFLVIHCRSVVEHYLPIENHFLRFQKAISLAHNTPVVINGDIDSLAKGRAYLEQLTAVGFMSARYWLKNPFLFLEESTSNSQRELFYQKVLDVAAQKLHQPYSIGKQIELSNFIYGKDNPHFERLKQLNTELRQ